MDWEDGMLEERDLVGNRAEFKGSDQTDASEDYPCSSGGSSHL